MAGKAKKKQQDFSSLKKGFALWKFAFSAAKIYCGQNKIETFSFFLIIVAYPRKGDLPLPLVVEKGNSLPSLPRNTPHFLFFSCRGRREGERKAVPPPKKKSLKTGQFPPPSSLSRQFCVLTHNASSFLPLFFSSSALLTASRLRKEEEAGLSDLKRLKKKLKSTGPSN